MLIVLKAGMVSTLSIFPEKWKKKYSQISLVLAGFGGDWRCGCDFYRAWADKTWHHPVKKEGIKHQVLNAKYHEKEAAIVAQAGKYGAVTISTNMAGRGTDIMLGGNSEFLAKEEMRKNKYSEEMIEAANSFNETDDEHILKARKTFKTLV